MNDNDVRFLWFSKMERGPLCLRCLVVFHDGSASVEEGDIVEIIFEESPDAWLDAIKYLRLRGYSECLPP